jgi:hypothetical protein
MTENYREYDLWPILKTGFAIMGFTMIAMSFGAMYGSAWAFTVMGLGYLFVFSVGKQTNVEAKP